MHFVTTQREFDSRELLDPPFSSQAIQARIDALDSVIRYIGLLTQLASGTAGRDANAAAIDLGRQIAGASKRFASAENVADATEYATPLGDLAGAIFKIAIEEEQTNEIREVVEAAAPAVRTITTLLRDDIENVAARRQIVFSKRRAESIRQYETKSYPDESARRRLLETIRTNEDMWNQMIASGGQVGALIGSLSAVHEALVIYVKSARSDSDLAGLAAAVEFFATRSSSVLSLQETTH